MITRNLPELNFDELKTALVGAFARGDLLTLESFAQTAVSNFPDEPIGYFALSAVYQARKDYDRAVRFARQGVDASPNSAEGLSNLGSVLIASRKFQEAEVTLTRAITKNPYSVEAHNNLGLVLMHLGRISEAEAEFKFALNVNNGHWSSWNNLSTVQGLLEKNDDAIVSAKRAVELSPSSPAPYFNLAKSLLAKKEVKFAEEMCKKGLLLDSTSQDGKLCLAEILLAQKQLTAALVLLSELFDSVPNDVRVLIALSHGLVLAKKFKEAEAHLVRAHAIEPDNVSVLTNLTDVLRELKRYDDAISYGEAAVSISPMAWRALNNLGLAYAISGQTVKAIDAFQRAAVVNPASWSIHSNLGTMFVRLARWMDAERAYLQAIACDSSQPELHNNLGSLYGKIGSLIDALNHLDKSLVIDESVSRTHSNKANILCALGRYKDAERHYEQAIALDPGNLAAKSSFLFHSAYFPELTDKEIFQRHRSIAKTIPKPKVTGTFKRRVGAGKAIRVGFVSGDFRSHATMFFLWPLLRNIDRNKFELYAYSTSEIADDLTETIKASFDGWCSISFCSNEEAVIKIEGDQIDILVDLSGHSEGNRLAIFKARPAKLQITYCGTVNGTGIDEIDYFLTDWEVAPSGSDTNFAEKVWRINTPFICYEPPQMSYDPGQLPALRNGFITFGSLSRTVRLNDELLIVWGKILDAVPNSKLVLDQRQFAHTSTKNYFYDRMSALGLPIHQIELKRSRPHWPAYQGIDISLDCFPHSVGTTGVESLWMGVPILTRLDRPPVGRIMSSTLKAVDLHDWIAEGKDAYIDKAIKFSSDLSLLTSLRLTLRERMQASALLDGKLFARKIEEAFVAMLGERQSEN